VLADIAACACFVVASLTLESGLVILPLAIATYWAGLRGISRNAIVVMLLLAVGYVVLRVAGLHMIGNAVGERQSGLRHRDAVNRRTPRAVRRSVLAALRVHDHLFGADRAVLTADCRSMDRVRAVGSRCVAGVLPE